MPKTVAKTAPSMDRTEHILATIRHFGDASSGQIAAWMGLPERVVAAALVDLRTQGKVEILPKSLTYTVAG